MAKQAFGWKLGAVVLAGALAVGSGIVGAQTASPSRSAATSGARVDDGTAAPDATPPAQPSPLPAVGTRARLSPYPTMGGPGASPTPSAASGAAVASTPFATVGRNGSEPPPFPTADTGGVAPPVALAATAPAAPAVSSPVAPATGLTPGITVTATPQARPLTVTPVWEHSVRGTLVAVQGAGLLLRQAGGGEERVEVTAATLITQDRQQVSAAALRPGSRIVAIGAPRADGALAARAMLVTPPSRPEPGHPPPFAPHGRPKRS